MLVQRLQSRIVCMVCQYFGKFWLKPEIMQADLDNHMLI